MGQIVIKSYETKKSIVTPVVFLIIGLLLFINPGNIVEFISYIFGGVFLTLGIGKMIFDSRRADKTTGDSFYALIMIVLGLIFMVFSGTIEFIVRLSIGIWIIINGLKTIAIGANLMQLDRRSVVSLIIGFILIIIGIYTVFVSNLVFSTIGLVITLYSILEIVNYFYILTRNK